VLTLITAKLNKNMFLETKENTWWLVVGMGWHPVKQTMMAWGIIINVVNSIRQPVSCSILFLGVGSIIYAISFLVLPYIQ